MAAPGAGTPRAGVPSLSPGPQARGPGWTPPDSPQRAGAKASRRRAPGDVVRAPFSSSGDMTASSMSAAISDKSSVASSREEEKPVRLHGGLRRMGPRTGGRSRLRPACQPRHALILRLPPRDRYGHVRSRPMREQLRTLQTGDVGVLTWSPDRPQQVAPSAESRALPEALPGRGLRDGATPCSSSCASGTMTGVSRLEP